MVLGLTSGGIYLEMLAIPVGATSFAFSTKLVDLSDYTVSVDLHPVSLSQTCSVAGGIGDLSGADPAGIAVTCATNRYQVGGTVNGLPAGTSVSLDLSVNGPWAETLAVSGNTFMFNTMVLDGSYVNVTVSTHPAGSTCSPSANAGNLNGQNCFDVLIYRFGCGG